MFRNYLTVSLRTLLRHKIYSAINVLGLAVGMACCVLILLFVNDELSYDRHHKKADRIYRVLREMAVSEGGSRISDTTSGPLAAALERDIPEVGRAIWTVSRAAKWLSVGDRVIQRTLCLAEPDILDVFTFQFIAGDPESAFRDPYGIVLRERTAIALFGNEDPLGQIVAVDDIDFRGDYRVTGVVRIPRTSTFQFGALVSTMPRTFVERLDQWVARRYWRSFRTYALLAEGANARDVEAKLPDLMASYMGEEVRAANTYHLQALTRTHLYSGQDYGVSWGGDIQQVYMFIALAGFLLLIACINFVNLATARASDRAREVGLRKVVGARRVQLVGQFLGQATILAIVASLFALAAIQLTLPLLNELTHKDLALGATWTIVVVVFAIFVGLLSGIYPALVLSGFKPVDVMRGSLWRGAERAWFREGLVVLQFAVSIGVIAMTVVVQGQLAYLRTKDLGFDKEQVVHLNLFYLDSLAPKSDDVPKLSRRYHLVKEAFLRHPNVMAATAARPPQGVGAPTVPFRAAGIEEEVPMHLLSVDEDYFGFFGIDLKSGRSFTKMDVGERWPKSRHLYLVNEAAAKHLGWDDPIGKQLTLIGSDAWAGPVVGVVKDFHVKSLHHPIEPAVFDADPGAFRRLYLKIRPGSFQETLPFLEETWNRFLPTRPFSYEFLDKALDQKLYENEIRTGRVFGVFAGLTVFIACLGLVGLISYATIQRRKEIGVRRVLAASVGHVVFLLSRDFLKLVVLANLIALPIAYFAVDSWLQGFAYRIDLGPGQFLFAGFAAFGIASASVSYLTIKAATASPINAIRSE